MLCQGKARLRDVPRAPSPRAAHPICMIMPASRYVVSHRERVGAVTTEVESMAAARRRARGDGGPARLSQQ